MRGTFGEYDQLRQMGNPGWDFRSVVKFFKKSENNLYFGNDTKIHGQDGELTVGNMYYACKIRDKLKCAAAEMGHKIYKDLNGAQATGFGDAQGIVKDGKRCSTFTAFLQPCSNRSNLFIATEAYVNKIIIDKTNSTALGVQVNVSGNLLNLYASKEVIVSAGSILTPTILMHSGLGPWRQLQNMNISIIHDLHVGKNLRDQASLLYFVTLQTNETKHEEKDAIDDLYDFMRKGKGSFTTIGLANYVGFVSMNSDGKPKYPNVQINHQYFEKGSFGKLQAFLNRYGLNEAVSAILLEKLKQYPILVFIPALTKPKSRGYVELISADPLVSPRIVMNYLKEQEDWDTWLEVVKFLAKLMKTKCMKKLNPKFVDLKICPQYKFKSVAYFKCFITQFLMSGQNFVGTCKMGPDSDHTAVVNSTLQVRGVNCLRIASNCIFPNMFSGNNMPRGIMIAELLSALLKQEYPVV